MSFHAGIATISIFGMTLPYLILFLVLFFAIMFATDRMLEAVIPWRWLQFLLTIIVSILVSLALSYFLGVWFGW
ncbi:hypothetical protein HYS48_05170 [Candidatus Woesearchaeota archaeon]|nr:hypothetical protein [Candidatus Woesearchaeota archaeon]